MSPLLLATRSDDKAREIRRILDRVGIDVVSLADAGVQPSPEEDAIEAFHTFRENAIAKARYFLARCGRPTLADDSGLVVPALQGEPGVRSRRFSGRTDLLGHDLDIANNRTLLDRLHDTPVDRRNAHYLCAAALIMPDGRSFVALGSVSGIITTEPAGDEGFGYDPLFFIPHLRRTLGQVDAATKDGISHRAHAFRALAGCVAG